MFEKIEASARFKNSITAALENGKLSHALILEGSSEKDRLESAKEIALYILCKNEGTKPCLECSSCRKILNSTHPDVHILQKEEGSTMIKVDAVRELKRKALVFPNDGDKSIFIINGAENMNVQAQNALLKIFEEPSKHLLFILCCTAKASLLDTVISRATSYSLGKESETDFTVSEKEKASTLASELLLSLSKENELSFLKKLSVLQKDKALFKLMLSEVQIILRDVLVLQSGGNTLISNKSDSAREIKNKLTQKNALEMLKTVNELEEGLKLNPNYNLTLTRFSSLLFSIKSS